MPENVDLLRNTETGSINEGAERVITFRVRAFQALEDRLSAVAGAKAAKTLLYQMGNELGRVAQSYWKDEIKSEDDLGNVFDRAMILRGWGRCLSLEKLTREGMHVYVITLKGTSESHGRVSKRPTFDLMLGSVAGWLEAYLKQKAVSGAETACVSMGNQSCVFEMTFLS